jgi:hypothetical protein
MKLRRTCDGAGCVRAAAFLDCTVPLAAPSSNLVFDPPFLVDLHLCYGCHDRLHGHEPGTSERAAFIERHGFEPEPHRKGDG